MSRRREDFEAQIEALVAPHVERVRGGASVPLGRIRDLYPSRQDDAGTPTGENCVWAAALDAVTSRHGITCATGFFYTRSSVSPIPPDFPAEPQFLLVPREFNGPDEAHDLDSAERHRTRGLYFWSHGCAEEALEELRVAVQLKPDWADAHESLAVVLCDSSQSEAGIAAYREAIRLDPHDEGKYNQLGCELQFKADRPADAIRVYRDGIRVLPGSSWLHFRLALALSGVGHDEEAIAEYHEAIRLDPSEAGCHLNLGHLLCEASRLEEALEEYQEALRLYPDDHEVAELIRQVLDQL